MSVLLQARGLSRRFAGLLAVDNVDLTLESGKIHALIGPNGAGKTTLVGLLSGRIAADRGQVMLEGRDITAFSADRRVRAGIGYTFQITSVFPGMRVFDNVALAVQGGRSQGGDLAAAVVAALAHVGLEARTQDLAGDLSYGHQRLLELAMGLALKPRLLILDEPTQGLASGEIAGFKSLVRALVPEVTVLLIEHNMEVVMELAETITVLVGGQVLAEGPPEAIRANRSVQEAYLGA